MESGSASNGHGGATEPALWPRIQPAVVPLVAFAVVMSMTAFAVGYVRQLERSANEVAFEIASRDRSAAVRREFETSKTVVDMMGSFFDASTEVRREDFDVFVRTLLEKHRSLSVIGWVPWVKHADRARHEAEAHSDYPAYRISERERQGMMIRRRDVAEYFPVRYILPLEGNEAAVGFDLASDSLRREAVMTSRDKGEVISTPPIELVQGQAAEKSILLNRPIFRAPPEASGDSEGEFTGVVTAVFRVSDVVERSLETLEPMGVDFDLIDVSEAGRPKWLATHWSRTRGQRLDRSAPERERPLWIDRFEIAGRKYRLDFYAAEGRFQGTITLAAVALLTAGTMLAFALAAFLYILQRSHAHAKEHAMVLQRHSRRLIEVQEAERHHLARELHDQFGQDLTALRVNMHMAASSKDRDKTTRVFTECNLIIDRILEQVRAISLDLRPTVLDDLGLKPALHSYLKRETERCELKLDFECGPEVGRLPKDVETAAFRVTQEAVVNVVRHAGASRLHVTLSQGNGALEVEVSDDGVGFDPGANRDKVGRYTSCGLLGMQERVTLVNGEIQIDSRRGSGSRVKARIPVG